MGLKRKNKPRVHLEEVPLNITALLDMMTVLLFFLIQSFMVSSMALTPPAGVRLPTSSKVAEPEETVVVALSAKELRGDNKLLTTLAEGKFKPYEIAPDHRTIIPLKEFLDKEQKKRLAVYKGAGDLSILPPGKLLIQADKEIPFGILKYVLHTATVTGYSDYQFVVVSESGDPSRAPASPARK
ncbi:MAG: biopolymer transporter ExbD [Bdellovibrionota bacterium]